MSTRLIISSSSIGKRRLFCVKCASASLPLPLSSDQQKDGEKWIFDLKIIPKHYIETGRQGKRAQNRDEKKKKSIPEREPQTHKVPFKREDRVSVNACISYG